MPGSSRWFSQSGAPVFGVEPRQEAVVAEQVERLAVRRGRRHVGTAIRLPEDLRIAAVSEPQRLHGTDAGGNEDQVA